MNYKIEYMSNGAWTELKNWSRPIMITHKLDETLDGGNVVLNCQEKTHIPPYTPLRITMSEDGEENIKKYYVTTQKPNKRQGQE